MRMRKLFAAALCILLLAGCAAPERTLEEVQPPLDEGSGEASAAPAGEDGEAYVTALTVSFEDLEPYAPLTSMTPDAAGVDTMGEILCDKTLPGGTRVVCYWHPEHRTNPEHQYEKYWAIHLGDTLLRFCAEESGYESGYDVTPFSGVLGKNGFRIEAPRGAAYTAFDYYVFDETGVPELLVDCTNRVLEADADGDGVKELLHDYHAGQFVTYTFLRDGEVYSVEVMSLLSEKLPFPALAFGNLEDWQDGTLPVEILVGGWDVIDEPESEKTTLQGRLRLTQAAAELELPASLGPLEEFG